MYQLQCACETSATSRPEKNDVGRERFGLLEFRPLRLAQQLELQLQEVAQRKAAHGVRDSRLVGKNVVYVSDAMPGVDWRHGHACTHLSALG